VKIQNRKLKLLGRVLENLKYFVGGVNYAPVFVAWLPTNNCNLKCQHCTSTLDSMPVDAGKVMLAARRIAQSKVFGVTISGGEPLILPNIN
jgi:MoaA/NifB/PqqE/SkfB family radical SAM enzyme